MPGGNFTTFPQFSEDFGPPSKRCKRCRQVKPITEFYTAKKQRFGVHHICKECFKADYREKWKDPERKRRLIEENKFRIRARDYGVDRAEYGRMFAAQDGKCAICGNPPSGIGREKDLVVDHDHITGRTRLLLCQTCNLGLGKFADDSDRLRKAADYLDRFRDQTDPPESQNV